MWMWWRSDSGMEMTVVQTWRLEADSQCPPKEPGVGGHGLYTEAWGKRDWKTPEAPKPMSSAWLQDQIHVSVRDLVQKNKWGGSCRMAHLRPCGLTYTSTHEHTNNCTYTAHKSAHKYLHIYHIHKSTWILAHITHTHTTQRTQIHTQAT